MKLLGSTKKDVDSYKNNENKQKLESVKVVLVQMIINIHQKFYLVLFRINNLDN